MTIFGMEVYKQTEQQRIINELGKSAFQFYLNGSRYFGVENTNSDYDFFAQSPNIDTENNIHKYLKKLGFVFVHDESYMISYKDDQIDQLLWHKEANIHIQLVKDWRVKFIAQEFIKNITVKVNNRYYVSKTFCTPLEITERWNEAYAWASRWIEIAVLMNNAQNHWKGMIPFEIK